MKAHVPNNNQPNLTSHRGSKQRLQNDNIVDAMMTPDVMVQEAMLTATMVDRNKCARLHQQQPTLLIDVDQPHQQLQRREAPAIRLTAIPQYNVNNATIIPYCHIVRCNDNTRQMQGKNVMTPMQQSNVHVVVCGMQR
jgi:hypothetical protein